MSYTDTHEEFRPVTYIHCVLNKCALHWTYLKGKIKGDYIVFSLEITLQVLSVMDMCHFDKKKRFSGFEIYKYITSESYLDDWKSIQNIFSSSEAKIILPTFNPNSLLTSVNGIKSSQQIPQTSLLLKKFCYTLDSLIPWLLQTIRCILRSG